MPEFSVPAHTLSAITLMNTDYIETHFDVLGPRNGTNTKFEIEFCSGTESNHLLIGPGAGKEKKATYCCTWQEVFPASKGQSSKSFRAATQWHFVPFPLGNMASDSQAEKSAYDFCRLPSPCRHETRLAASLGGPECARRSKQMPCSGGGQVRFKILRQ